MQARRKTRSAQRAYTMVEMMVVIVILGVLLNIATPGLISAREHTRARACVTNLKRIDSAKEQYALDNKLAVNASAPLMTDLAGSGTYLKNTPICPNGGTYSINSMGTS